MQQRRKITQGFLGGFLAGAVVFTLPVATSSWLYLSNNNTGDMAGLAIGIMLMYLLVINGLIGATLGTAFGFGVAQAKCGNRKKAGWTCIIVGGLVAMPLLALGLFQGTKGGYFIFCGLQLGSSVLLLLFGLRLIKTPNL